jgi:hypothetical protein
VSSRKISLLYFTVAPELIFLDEVNDRNEKKRFLFLNFSCEFPVKKDILSLTLNRGSIATSAFIRVAIRIIFASNS